MARQKPVPMICWYRPKKGKERAFGAIVARHWAALHAAGLVTDDPPRVFRGEDRRGRRVFVEQFSWKSEAAAEQAHYTAEIRALWGPMAELGEEMDFIAVEELRVTPASRSRRPSRRSSARARRG